MNPPTRTLGDLLFFGRVQKRFLAMDEAEGRMTTVLQENLTGIRVVRAFARQDFECAKFGEKNEAFRDRTYRMIRLLGVFWSSSDLLCLTQTGIVFIAGAAAMIDGMTVGTFYAFLTCEFMIIWPVRHMGRVLADLGKAMVAFRRLREVFQTPAESAGDSPDAEGPELRGGIRVDDLTFSYPESQPVLRNLSLDVRAGETVALIGPPGSGKTTLVQLLLRLYEPPPGTVFLDDIAVETMPRDRVRAQVGAVLQEPFLFSKTISANIRMGRAGSSQDDIVESTQAACIHDSIESFENGYDTLVGERGVTLSGGQRQRVTIARALLKKPPILILDDALSAIDTDTEARILEVLRRRRGVATTLIIAHRLSTVVQADRVFVLDGGQLVQQGTHKDLVGVEGIYRKLWNVQSAFEGDLKRDLNRDARGAAS